MRGITRTREPEQIMLGYTMMKLSPSKMASQLRVSLPVKIYLLECN
uniref:Uncharacterized protein n=1 Tax=Anguilla anguilla TaxID=7936 RepID=A0A0E9V9F2_ANGAN